MSDRTRRGITLSWLVLFVLSILLQAGNLTNPQSTLAVHDEDLFELDGNALTTASDDWDEVFNGTSEADSTRFIVDPVDDNNDETFTGGETKDDQPIGDWLWKHFKASQAKNDITHAFAAAYTKTIDGSAHSIIYFGLNKYEADGDNFVGFWFVQDQVGLTGDGNAPGSPFVGEHVVGDILVLADYTNGGALASFSIFRWVGSGGDANAAGTLDTVASGVPCTGGAGDVACGATNGANEVSPWPYTARDADLPGEANTFLPGTLFEGGIDLTALDIDEGCFSTFIAETRASQSVDATLSDFAMGSFSFCEQPTLTTQVSGTSITIGSGSVTDTAHLSGSKGPVTGTVDFFMCGPTGAPAECTTGGVDAGHDKVVNGSGDALSNPMSPIVSGWYCFRAEFTPTAGTKYLAVDHTVTTNECFEVLKASPAIVTFATQSVSAGSEISDSATLSGGFSPTGTITFSAYGPSDATCAGTAVFTSAPVTVSGNGTYGPVSFLPATSGVYRWIASYSGDANNNAVAGVCNDTGENDTVNKVQPTITTSAPETVTIGAAIHDSALLASGVNPTGSITFNLYGPDDATCAGAVAFTTSLAVNGNGTYGPVSFTPTAVGTYRWVASYSGDGNNLAATGACNDAGETDTVQKTSPTIATVLHGGGQNGTSITVPLGTAVNDSSTLSGATADAGGTVHYQVFSNASCQTLVFDAGTKAVVNGIAGDSNAFTINLSGTYYWQADYSGDAKNNAASSACNLEIVTVAANIPAISTSANELVNIGGAIHDTAALSGGFNPTGSITFRVWASATCAGAALATFVVPVSGNGSYGPVSYTPTTAGVYHWIASYSGDVNNAPVSGGCGDAGENDTVNQPQLTILKDVAGFTGGTAVNGTPIAKVGDTLTYTLAYDIASPPATNGVITDPIPTGLEYVTGSATTNAEFDLVSYNAATRTLTWLADVVSVDGSVTFKVTVLDGSFNLPQPIVNTATIDSTETLPDDDTANVLVQVVLAATATPVATLPPTDTIDSGDQAPSNPGFGLMLALLVLAGFGLVVGYLTPTPARARREEVRRR
jgi:uncharacterized repeat protein (TIGR01451 family)